MVEWVRSNRILLSVSTKRRRWISIPQTSADLFLVVASTFIFEMGRKIYTSRKRETLWCSARSPPISRLFPSHLFFSRAWKKWSSDFPSSVEKRSVLILKVANSLGDILVYLEMKISFFLSHSCISCKLMTSPEVWDKRKLTVIYGSGKNSPLQRLNCLKYKLNLNFLGH